MHAEHIGMTKQVLSSQRSRRLNAARNVLYVKIPVVHCVCCVARSTALRCVSLPTTGNGCLMRYYVDATEEWQCTELK